MNDKVTYLYDNTVPDWDSRNALAFLGSVVIGACVVVGMQCVNIWRKVKR